MASTYSANLALELMATGEKSGTWGDITNTNEGTLIEQAIVVLATVPMLDATTTISMVNGATCSARCFELNLTGAITAQRDLVVPTINKPYIVKNSTTGGFGVRVKTSAGTGITVGNGLTRPLYVDGTNVVDQFNSVGALTSSGIINTPIGAGSTHSTGAFTTLTTSSTATIGGSTTVTGNLSVSNTVTTLNLAVTDDTTFGDNVTVNGITVFNDAVQIFGTLGQGGGDAGFGNNVTITGVCTAGSFVTSSDYRLKEDIEDYKGAWEAVRALRVRRFKMKSDGREKIGFLAHEAQEHVPEMVHGDKDGSSSQGVEPMVAIGVLTKALQEAMARIEFLEFERRGIGIG